MIRKIVTKRDSKDRLAEKTCQGWESLRAYKGYAEVDPGRKYQTIMGFGGAITEAAAVTLSKMSEDQRSEVISSYYDQKDGLGYSLGRVHINSCDFALGNYTYVEDNDVELKTFSIEHDLELIIPLIKEAIKERGAELEILASPWSPPAWMKSNQKMNQGGYLLPEFRQSWANYYVKFIKEYEQAGIPIWGITVQNEPEATQTWDSCIYTAEEERDFIKDYLGPTLQKAGYGDKKVLIWDHNRDVVVRRVKTVLDDPEAAKFVWGTGIHWYISEAFENVGKVHELFPDKHILFTEGCQEGGVHLGAWHTGERYGRNIIGDMNNWCKGYLDWNIVLDQTGGPNHVNNLCDAPIIADTINNQLHYNSSYYYIGHFSKYVNKGATRIFSDCSLEGIDMIAFENPDQSLVVIMMNQGDRDHAISLKLGQRYLNMNLANHSIVTYLLN